MRSFNRIQKLLKEDFGDYFKSYGVGLPALSGAGNAHDRGYLNAYINDPAARERMNGYMTYITNRPFFDPWEPMNFLKNKLMQSGLHLEINPELKDIAEPNKLKDMEFPISLYGGTYGYNPKIGDIEWNDGFSEKYGYSYTLKVKFTNKDGFWFIEPKIVQKKAETPKSAKTKNTKKK